MDFHLFSLLFPDIMNEDQTGNCKIYFKIGYLLSSLGYLFDTGA